MSALRNQLDEMRHRGDYSGGFLDDSQTVSLQRQLDNQREVMEENQKEVRGQGSHYRFFAEGFPLMAVSVNLIHSWFPGQ